MTRASTFGSLALGNNLIESLRSVWALLTLGLSHEIGGAATPKIMLVPHVGCRTIAHLNRLVVRPA